MLPRSCHLPRLGRMTAKGRLRRSSSLDVKGYPS
jgi:hypothetical protein